MNWKKEERKNWKIQEKNRYKEFESLRWISAALTSITQIFFILVQGDPKGHQTQTQVSDLVHLWFLIRNERETKYEEVRDGY